MNYKMRLIILSEVFFVYALSIALAVPRVQLTSFYNSLGDYFDFLILVTKNFGKDYYEPGSLSSRFTLSPISILDNLECGLSIFCGTSSRAIIIEPTNSSLFFESMAKARILSKCTEHFKINQSWTPYIFFVWPNPILLQQDFEDQIVQSYSLAYLGTGRSFLVNSEVYVLAWDEKEQTSVYELYSIQNITFFQKIMEPYGKLTFQSFQRKIVRRGNFKGATIRAATEQEKSIQFRKISFTEANDELILGNTYNTKYFKAMTVSLNVSMVGIRSSGFISLHKNGSLGGIGKQLLDGEMDIGINHHEYLPYRAKNLSFMHPHYVSEIVAYFKQPPATSIRDIYIGSIRSDLRLAIVCTWIVMIGCLVIISFVQNLLSSEDLPDHDVIDALHWGISALSQQGSCTHPCSISMKIGVLVSRFFSLITFIGFSASVVSQLSVPVIPIKSFDDLLRSDMQVYVDNQTHSVKNYLENAVKQGRIEPMSLDDRLMVASIGIQKICEGSNAFLSVADEFYLTVGVMNYTNDLICKTFSEVNVDPIGMPMSGGMVVPKNSPYKEYFKYAQIRMREFGIHKRLFDNYEGLAQPRCQEILSPETPQLGIHDTMSAFTFLLIMEILSVILLLAEICLKRKQFCSTFSSDGVNSEARYVENQNPTKSSNPVLANQLH